MKLALFCNLKFTKMCINFEKYASAWALRQICLFEFIRVEGGAKFMKHFKAQAWKAFSILCVKITLLVAVKWKVWIRKMNFVLTAVDLFWAVVVGASALRLYLCAAVESS
jgi:hypothetical protein